MDDMLMLVKTKNEAVRLLHAVDTELKKTGLQTNRKSHIGRIQDGFTFLNVNFKLTPTGKVKKKLGKKTISRELSRLKTIVKKLKDGRFSVNTLV